MSFKADNHIQIYNFHGKNSIWGGGGGDDDDDDSFHQKIGFKFIEETSKQLSL